MNACHHKESHRLHPTCYQAAPEDRLIQIDESTCSWIATRNSHQHQLSFQTLATMAENVAMTEKVARDSYDPSALNWLITTTFILVPVLAILAVCIAAYRQRVWCFSPRRVSHRTSEDIEVGIIDNGNATYSRPVSMSPPPPYEEPYVSPERESAAGEQAGSSRDAERADRKQDGVRTRFNPDDLAEIDLADAKTWSK